MRLKVENPLARPSSVWSAVAVMAAIRRCRSPEGPWVLGATLRKQIYATYPLLLDGTILDPQGNKIESEFWIALNQAPVSDLFWTFGRASQSPVCE